jgi:hypothetical protein
MTRAEVLRHNDVERFSGRFGCRVAKNSLGTAVPKPDQAAEIRLNDRVRPIMHQFPTEAVGVESEMTLRRHSANLLFDAVPIEIGFPCQHDPSKTVDGEYDETCSVVLRDQIPSIDDQPANYPTGVLE